MAIIVRIIFVYPFRFISSCKNSDNLRFPTSLKCSHSGKIGLLDKKYVCACVVCFHNVVRLSVCLSVCNAVYCD